METVLLAAGKASRMGTVKLVLPFKERPILAHAIDSALDVSARVIVVTGFHESELQPMLEQYRKRFPSRFVIVHNPNPERGQFSSTRIGVAAVSENEHFTIAMGDTPLVKADHYRQLIPLLAEAEAVRPYCNDIPGHPVLCRSSLRSVILALADTATMRDLLAHRDVQRLDTVDPAWTTDIDTPESYRRLTLLGHEDSSAL